jgi:hypothetical protein
MDVLNIISISSTMPAGIYNLASNDYLETRQVGDIVSNELEVPLKFLTNKEEGESLPFLNNNKIKSTLNLDFTDTKSEIINYIDSIKDYDSIK